MTLPDGWLTEQEAFALSGAAQDLTVLELGAWKGRSTSALAKTARYVISVDRHKGIEEIGGEDSLVDYLANIRGLPNVAIVVANFEDFVPFLKQHSVSFVYIDGDHDAKAVQRDTEMAREIASTIIAYHDWDFPAVRQTATELLGEPDSIIGSIALFEVWRR